MKKSDILSDMLLDGFQDEDSAPLDIKAQIYKYLRYWWLFVLCVVVCIAGAMVYLFFSTPLYQASASLLIKVDKGIGFTQNAVYSDLEAYESTNKMENEVEVISSYSIMRDAIEELPLHASFFIEDRFSRRREIYGEQVPVKVVVHELSEAGVAPDDRTLKIHFAEEDFIIEFAEDSLQQYKYGQQIENWYGIFSIEKVRPFPAEIPSTLIVSLNNKDQLAGRFNASLTVEQSNRFSSVANLSLMDPVPAKAKDVLNKLVEVYNFQAVKEKNIIATNTIDFIDEQLIALTDELEAIERKIEDYKTSNNISDLSSELSTSIYNSGEFESQLSRNRTQAEVLESIERYLSNPVGMTEVTSSLTIQDETLASLVIKFNDLQSEKERLLRTIQPNNPLILNLEEQLSSLKNNILTNLSNIKAGLNIENRNLQARVNELDNRVRAVPEIERGLLELTREQGIKQEHYLYLVKKREESQLSLAATTVSNARIIDAASGGGGPVKPNRKIILGFAFVMGLGIPFAFVYLKNTLSGKITQKQEIKRITSIPIIAEISHNDKKEILAISEKKRTPIAEQFRLLRSNLKFQNNGLNDKVILVTSSISGEGKTFFSLNFGVSLSLTGKKVIILEFDLRKPALLESIFVKRGKGITDYLNSDDMTIDDLIIKFDPVSNLYVIGCGTLPDDPAEIMLNPKVGLLLEKLRERFDYIILDTAPVGTVADAFNLVSYSDYSLFIIRYNYTTKQHLNFIEENNISGKLKRPLIVMNDAKFGLGNYGYAYGYGYEEKKKVYS